METFHIDPPIVQSAMSGYSNPSFCQQILDFGAGMVLLGGYSLDHKTYQSSLQILKRGRLEFILPESDDELSGWIKERFPLTKKYPKQLVGINIRIVEADEKARERIMAFIPYIDVIELNAHCRQQEITVIGAGQALLKDLGQLEEIVKFLKNNFPTKHIGIKIRGIALENIDGFCDIINRNNISYIHVDCMIPGQNRAELKHIKDLRERTSAVIIGNNSVRTKEDIKQMLLAGASAISVARPLIKEPEFIKDVIRKWKYLNLATSSKLQGEISD